MRIPRTMTRLAAVLACLLAPAAIGAPISPKELDLLIRMRTPDAEVLRQVASRKLLEPISAETEKQLRTNGATEALIARLKSGKLTLGEKEAEAVKGEEAANHERQAQEEALDAQALELRRAATLGAMLSPGSANAAFTSFYNTHINSLIRLEEGGLKHVDVMTLRSIRYYVLFYGASWNAPSRQFATKLVKYYKKMKPEHPDFEVIFISSDKSANEMVNFMKKDEMPWPTIQYEALDDDARKYASGKLPWLIVLDGAGREVLPVDVRKTPNPNELILGWVSPAVTLERLTTLLTSG